MKISEIWKKLTGQYERKDIYTPSMFNDYALAPDNFTSLIKANRNWVYVAAQKNANSVAQVPLRLYVARRTSGSQTRKLKEKQKDYIYNKTNLQHIVRKAQTIEEVVEHPFLDLMKNVNPYMNSYMLKELTELYQEIVGNAYWYIVKDGLGIPRQIWVIQADRMRIVPSKEEFIAGYIYLKAGLKKIPFEKEEIIHFKMASLKSPYYGMSPIQAEADAYNIDYNINKFELNTFGNQGVISGAIEYDTKLGDREFRRLKKEINKTYKGISNANKIAILEGGGKWRNVALSPKELNYLAGRKVTKEQILNAYGQNLGMYDKDATRANSETANYTYMRDTIYPRLIRIEEKINEQLIPMYRDNLFVAFDNPIPEDREYRLKERESNLKTGYSSINLERQKEGEEPVAWGDTPIMPMNMMPYGESAVKELSDKVTKIIRSKLSES